MSKSKGKDFTAGLGSVFAPKEKQPDAQPEEQASQEERATFIISRELIEDTKNIAYWDRVLLKDVINDALSNHVKDWKKKNGELKQRPETFKGKGRK